MGPLTGRLIRNSGGTVQPIRFEKQIMSNTAQYRGHDRTVLYYDLDFPDFQVRYRVALENQKEESVAVELEAKLRLKNWRLNLVNFFGRSLAESTCRDSLRGLTQEILRQDAKRRKFMAGQ